MTTDAEFVAVGIPQEWVAVLRKAGVNTMDVLKEQNPNKLHGQLCGLRKKMKLELKNPTPEEVKEWVK